MNQIRMEVSYFEAIKILKSPIYLKQNDTDGKGMSVTCDRYISDNFC